MYVISNFNLFIVLLCVRSAPAGNNIRKGRVYFTPGKRKVMGERIDHVLKYAVHLGFKFCKMYWYTRGCSLYYLCYGR